MAAPTDTDLEAFNGLPDDDKRALLIAEIEKGMQGQLRKSTAADVVRRGMERHGLKHGCICRFSGSRT